MTNKFEYLDGLRGLSALLVVFYHGMLFTGHSNEYLLSSFNVVTYALSFGHFSVSVFIVLSGFCLCIPVALSNDKLLKGGFKRYITRRFRRIVPPYYVAIALFLTLIAVLPILQTSQNTAWDSKIPITWQSIASHLLLVHNFSTDWIYKIDGPMWSVATEWQIYFIFPVLIVLWKKFGVGASISFAIILGFILNLNLRYLHPGYLGLFAMGMAASIISFSSDERIVRFKSIFNWRLLSKLAVVGILIGLPVLRYKAINVYYLENYVGILVSVVLINFTAVELNNSKQPLMLKLFNARASVKLGQFSYSIYLIHSPLLGLFNLLLLNYSLTINMRMTIMFSVFIPISVGFSYIFYYFIESKFTNSHLKKTEQKVLHPVLSKL
jgi:peptidoglycan/LPS O-acetylase OafA/YrhL